jgi:hypothetical protein
MEGFPYQVVLIRALVCASCMTDCHFVNVVIAHAFESHVCGSYRPSDRRSLQACTVFSADLTGQSFRYIHLNHVRDIVFFCVKKLLD